MNGSRRLCTIDCCQLPCSALCRQGSWLEAWGKSAGLRGLPAILSSCHFAANVACLRVHSFLFSITCASTYASQHNCWALFACPPVTCKHAHLTLLECVWLLLSTWASMFHDYHYHGHYDVCCCNCFNYCQRRDNLDMPLPLRHTSGASSSGPEQSQSCTLSTVQSTSTLACHSYSRTWHHIQGKSCCHITI